MKTTKIFSIIALIAAASMAFVSCEDDMNKNFKPAQVGDEIFFGGTAGYEDEARTVYGDKGDTGTPIMWYQGDTVRIYCAEASKVYGKSYCDYKVNNVVSASDKTIDPSKTSSSLTSAEAYGLQWGQGADAEGTHYFYGVYPSPRMFAVGSKEATTYNLNGNTLTAYLPSSQDPKAYVEAQEGNYTIHPAMRYAYMTAYNSATHTTEGVTMEFKPIVSAVEITIVNNSKMINTVGGQESLGDGIPIENISAVRISTTDGTAISGRFVADVQSNIITKVEGDDYVSVSVRDEDNYPITLGAGKSLTFTAFLALPEGGDLVDLKVSLLVGGIYKTAQIQNPNGDINDGILVNVKKKNFIHNLPLTLHRKAGSISSYSNWMSQIKLDTPISQLSIPGAGGATSAKLTNEQSKQQTLTISQLWNQGIRCFELMTDKSGSGDIAKNNVLCNGESTGITLDAAVDSIASNLVKYPSEFAIVIIGYQDADYNDYSRNAGKGGWMNGFNTWFNDNEHMQKYATKPYNGNITLAEAKGKIFCIARPVSMGVDTGWYTGFYAADNSKHNYTVVLGWGSHPDQWYARGFGKVIDNDINKIANYSLDNNHILSYGINNRPFYINESAPESYTYYEINTETNDIVTMNNEVKSFAYNYLNTGNTPYGSKNDMAWVQEWKRVSNNATSYKSSGAYDYRVDLGTLGGIGEKTEDYTYQWCNSVNEKKSDILNTLYIAQKNIYSMVINSLCCYYITNNVNSFKPRATFQRFSNYEKGYGYDDKYYSGGDIMGYDGSNHNNNSGSPTRKDRTGPFSWGGGLQGDIASAAKDMNEYFYGKLLEIGTNNLSGPTGIVLMDRVKNKINSDDDKPGYYLPQIIIANSIRYYGTIDNNNENM